MLSEKPKWDYSKPSKPTGQWMMDWNIDIPGAPSKPRHVPGIDIPGAPSKPRHVQGIDIPGLLLNLVPGILIPGLLINLFPGIDIPGAPSKPSSRYRYPRCSF